MTRAPLSSLLCLLAFAVAMSGACARAPALPPLNDPATDLRISGKFIWADLFTDDVETARSFYSRLFDWEWRWISQRPGHLYGMFYDEGVAVAGVAYREASEKGATYGRWVFYVSTPDVARASASVLDRGGRALLSERHIDARGDLAVLADPEGVPFGVMRSSSGDPPDYRAELGEWLWVGLASRDAAAASQFYASLFGYEVRDDRGDSDVVEYVLASGGHARAGIGQLPPDGDGKPTWLGFVRVADLEAALERARAAGAEVLYAPERRGEKGDLAIVADPFGAPIGLMQWSFEHGDLDAQEPQS